MQHTPPVAPHLDACGPMQASAEGQQPTVQACFGAIERAVVHLQAHVQAIASSIHTCHCMHPLGKLHRKQGMQLEPEPYSERVVGGAGHPVGCHTIQLTLAAKQSPVPGPVLVHATSP